MTNSSSDPWIAPDKLGHFLFCGLCTVAGYLLCITKPSHREWRNFRFLAGASLGAFFGALKEIGDGLGWWPGNVSIRDMGADVAGIVVALCLLILYEPQITALLSSTGSITPSFSALDDKGDVS
jgi:hypothetical protein